MIVLGIDPGYAIVGYGVLRYEKSRFTVLEYGTITTPKEMPFSERLVQIYHSMNTLLERFSPDSLAVEKLYFNTNTTTAIDVSQARGVIMLTAQLKEIPLYEYTPLQVKQSVTGYGRAEKKQVQEMTRMLLNLEKIPRPDDAADALAMAICHAHASGSLLGANGSVNGQQNRG